MTLALTDLLCTQCGLCCDGSLFADVELTGAREATRLEILGLEIEDDDDLVLVQPCAALEGRRCGIYAHRPSCCRTFECRLLQDARRGTVSVERARGHIREALGLVRKARAALVRLEQRDHHLPLAERVEEALATAAGEAPHVHRRSDELAATMTALERLIRTVFLHRTGSRGVRPTR